MLFLVQLTTLLSLLSCAAAACNHRSIKLNSNENLPNITDMHHAYIEDIKHASNGLDANGIVGSRVYGNLSPLEDVSAFCMNGFNGTRSADTTLGGNYGADARHGSWRGSWQWSTRKGSWNMSVADLGQQVNVSQSLEMGLDGSIIFELDAPDLKCEQQASGKWTCKGGKVCDK